MCPHDDSYKLSWFRRNAVILIFLIGIAGSVIVWWNQQTLFAQNTEWELREIRKELTTNTTAILSAVNEINKDVEKLTKSVESLQKRQDSHEREDRRFLYDIKRDSVKK